jgi:hypothetical protein
MGTRLLVLAPDACQTFIQKPGHYKVSGSPFYQGVCVVLVLFMSSSSSVTLGPLLLKGLPLKAAAHAISWSVCS